MKKLLLIGTILMALTSSCHSSKQVLPSVPVVVTNTDSVRTEYIETVRIDTVTVEVLVPAESIMQTVPDSTSHLETKFAVSEAWINPNGTLGHRLTNKEMAVPVDVIVPSKDTQTNSIATSIKEVPVPYPEPVYIERNFTWWERLKIGAFWYLLGISLISICWKFRKPILTVIKKLFKFC